MSIEWIEGSGKRGLSIGWIENEVTHESGSRLPLISLVGRKDGPRICVMGGVHVNEASSIEAAIGLSSHLNLSDLVGTVSIIPVVSRASQFRYSDTSHIDGKNLHWLYPGDPGGTHSERLANFLVREWASKCDVLVDLHGGDIGEAMLPYVVYQRTGDRVLDGLSEKLAAQFDTNFIVQLPQEAMSKAGRSCSAMAKLERCGLVCEAGSHGVPNPEFVKWHLDGLKNIAIAMSMLPNEASRVSRNSQQYLDYVWVKSSGDGLYFPCHGLGEHVKGKSLLGVIRDQFGRIVEEVRAPDEGFVLWQWCLQMVQNNAHIGAIGRPID